MAHTRERGFIGYLSDYLKRINGISTPMGGASWIQRPPETDTLRKLFAVLADRRVLYHEGCGVPRRDMIDSCERMREAIVDAMAALPESSKASPYLVDMRAACHQFQTYVERYFDSSGHGNPEESFYMAIGELRGSVGPALAAICQQYRMDEEILGRSHAQGSDPKEGT